MNKSNTFLRYFKETPEGGETNICFVSISDLDYSGTPIDEDGDDLDNDCRLYSFDGESYQQID